MSNRRLALIVASITGVAMGPGLLLAVALETCRTRTGCPGLHFAETWLFMAAYLMVYSVFLPWAIYWKIRENVE